MHKSCPRTHHLLSYPPSSPCFPMIFPQIKIPSPCDSLARAWMPSLFVRVVLVYNSMFTGVRSVLLCATARVASFKIIFSREEIKPGNSEGRCDRNRVTSHQQIQVFPEMGVHWHWFLGKETPVAQKPCSLFADFAIHGNQK